MNDIVCKSLLKKKKIKTNQNKYKNKTIVYTFLRFFFSKTSLI